MKKSAQFSQFDETRPLHALTPTSLPHRLPGSAKEQDVAVRVANLEPAKTIVSVLQRHAEGCSVIGKFGGERIRVWGIDEGIQPQEAVTLRVRHRHYVSLSLDKDLRSVAADDREKGVSIRLPESCLKAKLVAVKSNGLFDVANDEGR